MSCMHMQVACTVSLTHRGFQLLRPPLMVSDSHFTPLPVAMNRATSSGSGSSLDDKTSPSSLCLLPSAASSASCSCGSRGKIALLTHAPTTRDEMSRLVWAPILRGVPGARSLSLRFGLGLCFLGLGALLGAADARQR